MDPSSCRWHIVETAKEVYPIGDGERGRLVAFSIKTGKVVSGKRATRSSSVPSSVPPSVPRESSITVETTPEGAKATIRLPEREES